MKKIMLYINILLSLLITACSNYDTDIPTPPSGAEGETCEVSFWVSIPDAASASRGNLREATQNSVEKLKLLVFDAELGLYLYESDATLSEQKSENGIHKGKFTARLQLSDNPRIIHFVANVDKVPFQANEIAVLSQLAKESNQDAYWQRVEVSRITATANEDGTYTDVNAPGITDTNTTIELIRNFACVTVTAGQGADFTLDGFVLVNTATKGTVAPYMKKAVGGSYFPNYNMDGDAISSYEALINNGYMGIQPSDAIINGEVPGATSDQYTKDAKYLYERTQEVNPVFIIAKITKGGETKFFKIDIMKTTGEKEDYFKILRNFSYDVTINSVDAEGYDTPEEAARNVADNNLSVSTDLEDLTNIAYGDERLFVNKTEIIWTLDDPIVLKYKYTVNNENRNTEVNSLIFSIEYTGGKVYDFETKPYTIASDALDNEGFSIITIPHTGLPESGYKRQEITIKAGSLSRTITLILIKPYESTAGCSATANPGSVPSGTPQIAKKADTPVYMYFSLPAGLPESIFPLTFILSPKAYSITPNGVNMPVVSLLNHDNETMKNCKYGFEKVIEWDDYKSNASTGMVVECPFKTNYAASATTIYVYNEYFKFPLSTSFTNP